MLVSLVCGVLTGATVALFEWITRARLFDWVTSWPLWAQAIAPLVGLSGAAASLRWLANRASPSTADEYIRNFHDSRRRLDPRPVIGRVIAGISTLGFGGAMGFEGPSIYIGSALGSELQRRLSRRFSREDAKLLLVAGAAAGVSAIFKAPATGAVFALEVPYQDDLARRMLLPALLSSAAGYVTFVAFRGTAPLLPVRGAPPFDLADLGGAALIGLAGGVGARLFAWAVRWAKRVAGRGNPLIRMIAAGAVLAGLYAWSHAATDEGLTLGAGYRTVEWSLDPRHGVLLVLLIFVLRGVATMATVAGGGAGGLFIPLVIEGTLLGRAMAGSLGRADSTLFPVIGIAAFLGAGYRVPLAAVMFVAETTGRPGFVVPGLIAAAVAQLAMGRTSVSTYQVAARAGHLERRFGLPITSALQTGVATIPSHTTIGEFVWHHLVGTRERSIPVVDDGRYVGLARIDELGLIPRDRWDTATVSEIVRSDFATAQPDWLLRDAVTAMERDDIDRLAVVDDLGGFVGMIAVNEVLKLDEILDEATGDREE